MDGGGIAHAHYLLQAWEGTGAATDSLWLSPPANFIKVWEGGGNGPCRRPVFAAAAAKLLLSSRMPDKMHVLPFHLLFEPPK